MDVLFVMKHPGVIRNMESTVRLLAERGHRVHLAFETTKAIAAEARVTQLADEFEGITIGRAPAAKGPWAHVARGLRLGSDYLRYLDPLYAGAPKLRLRAAEQTPAAIRRVAALPGAAAVLRRLLPALERTLPPSPAAAEYLRSRDPAVLLVSPLIGLGSSQADYVRAARRLGVPAIFPVHSWDNLTNKGLLRDVPALTLVWSPAQVEEAVGLHGVPRERVEATGASAYDHWFDWSPSTTREQFAELIGLPDDRPFVLWVCSSPFIAPDEVSFVRRWLDALRGEGSPLADLSVLVRPHPQNAAQWGEVSLGHERVAIWPRGGEDPVDVDTRRHYFDSIHHSAAVIGINTSAQIESAIIGRPVHTILADEFRGTQEGTLHFQHIAEGDGHLVAAHSLQEHLGLLAASLAEPDESRGQRFLRAFVRPHGLDEPATPRVVAAIERVAASPKPPPETPPVGAGIVMALLPLVERSLRRRRPPTAARPDAVAEARKAVARLGETDGPVIAGPWLAEVGYELLYWIPFLRRAGEVVPGLAERLVVVSRGGTESWYDGVAGRYLDVFDELPPEQLEERLRALSPETGGYRKQYAETSFDRELLEGILGHTGRERARLLHPATMFGAYRALAKSGVPPEESDLFSFSPLRAPELAMALPESFVAARFYFSATLPETAENRALAEQVLRCLVEQTEVVLLDPPGSYDDHRALELLPSAHVHGLGGHMTPRNNLAIQTAVIARASGFVGTYGGLSYLPLFLGVPALALHSEPRFRERHLDLARRLAGRAGFGAYDVRSTAGIDLADALAHLTGPRHVAADSV